MIDLIRAKYDGNIELHDPCVSIGEEIPSELRDILAVSDGIGETMVIPNTGKTIVSGWIVYPHELISKQTSYYKNEYGIEGTVFADDGAGNPYYISDGKIFLFEPIDNESSELASSLEEFFAK